jgi:DNA invertase Pin-like site-specific DNA recombinase
MRIGYSYTRYSSPAQADGDSVRRQTALARAWCQRNRVTLDTSTTYEDRGRSAFRGKHRTKGILARFLLDVEGGRIPKGSVLILENLDRLSRENPWDAVPLLCQIVNAGLTVVTLSPAEVTYQRGHDLTPLILAVVEFGRGNSESKSKSDRLTAVWAEKQEQARVSRALVTRRLPAWVVADAGGALSLHPDRAGVVRRVVDLAIQGYGLSLIVRELTRTVAPWGRGKWSKAYVRKLLRGRATVGEYQPRRGAKADGEPVPGY